MEIGDLAAFTPYKLKTANAGMMDGGPVITLCNTSRLAKCQDINFLEQLKHTAFTLYELFLQSIIHIVDHK